LFFESSSRFSLWLEHDLFRPAFARRSVKQNDGPCQGLRAGGKPVPTPHRVRGRLFRDHALMDLVIGQFFNVTIMASALPLVRRGLGMTLVVCAVVIPLGLIGGLLVALAMGARFRAVRGVVAGLIDFFRAVPPLVLLIFIHAGLPFAGIRPTAFVSVCL